MTEDGFIWRIRFAIKREPTKAEPAPFKWIMLKAFFEDEKLAREWIKKVHVKIQTRYDLHSFED